MAKAYQFMADGFEDIEALAPVDILRRGGVDIKTVSITGSREVTSAHGVTILADITFEEANLDDADLLMLPGGMPGAANLRDHRALGEALTEQAQCGGMVSAICAAPMVLGTLGLLRGKRATCYPGFEDFLEGAQPTGAMCTVDGNITTGKGPGAALEYGYTLLAQLTNEQTAREVAEGMLAV